MVKQSHKRNPIDQVSVGKKPEMDLMNSSSALCLQNTEPRKEPGDQAQRQGRWGRCVPLCLHSPSSPARSGSGVAL